MVYILGTYKNIKYILIQLSISVIENKSNHELKLLNIHKELCNFKNVTSDIL